MKCVPQNKIADLLGNVIHDSHAEILALRAFNRFLLDQCADLAAKGSNRQDGNPDSIVEWRKPPSKPLNDKENHAEHVSQESDMRNAQQIDDVPDLWQAQPFRIKPSLRIHMYCSEAPCGDASMELTMAAQEDATPWTRKESSHVSTSEEIQPIFTSADSAYRSVQTQLDPTDPKSTPSLLPTEPKVTWNSITAFDSPDSESLHGRSYFDALGVVRRKPSRPDAPPTLSKSCSDKLALKQCTSLLSSISALLIHPQNAYIHTLIMPTSQYVAKACQRAFGPQGRMAELVSGWDPRLTNQGYCYAPFHVKSTARDFTFSRRSAANQPSTSVIPSNISSLSYASTQETLINGVLQGRKQADPKAASAVSRRRLWSLALSIATLIGEASLSRALSRPTYHDLKADALLQPRLLVKKLVTQSTLKGWKRNSGDDNWSLCSTSSPPMS